MIDLSHPLNPETPVYPGDPPFALTILDSTANAVEAGVRPLNVSQIAMNVHCGTHMDAPYHFFGDGATIDEVALERCVGPTMLVKLPESLHGGRIDALHLSPFEAKLRQVSRVVLNTGWHRRWGAGDYFSGHPVLTGEAAGFLADCGIQLVGVDTPSVDRPPFEAHLVFLRRGVLIVENLTNLDAILSEVFQLAAVPLKISGRDGSPVRAVALD